MKRVYKSEEEPELLCAYRQRHPKDIWEHFRSHKRCYRQVKEAILRDQHWLCAYCEISIKLAEHAGEVDDFRVEHFHPKNATQEHGHNFHLDWRNLLGVCHGGSQPQVPDVQWRYSQLNGDHSCDVPKAGKEISANILNPLEIPSEVRLFRYIEHDGRMLVDKASCPKHLQKKASTTIHELNLNAPRLMRMRLEVIHKLEETINEELAQGQTLEDVLQKLAVICLLPDYRGRLLPFFSLIRWYLGDVAEHVIKTSGSKL